MAHTFGSTFDALSFRFHLDVVNVVGFLGRFFYFHGRGHRRRQRDLLWGRRYRYGLSVVLYLLYVGWAGRDLRDDGRSGLDLTDDGPGLGHLRQLLEHERSHGNHLFT